MFKLHNHNIILPKYLEIVKKKGSSLSLPAHGLGGAKATILSFLFSVPPSARKKFWPSPPSLKLWRAGIQAGEKEGGWGEEFSPASTRGGQAI